MRRLRKPGLWTSLVALVVILAACGTAQDTADKAKPAKTKQKITVGAVTFAENQIVGEMYAQVLEKAGFDVDKKLTIGKRETLQPALQKGEIDVAPEYIGSMLAYLDPSADPSGDPAKTVESLKSALDAKGLSLLEVSQANDTNAFVVKKETADKHKLKTIGDLKPVASKLKLGGPPECRERPFCLPGLKETYGIEGLQFEPTGVCDAATAQALEADKIDVAMLCSTQSIIADKGWVVLEDDKKLQRADNIAPVVYTKSLTPKIEKALNSVSAKLTTENIIKLNARVELKKEDAAVVARDFLKQESLI